MFLLVVLALFVSARSEREYHALRFGTSTSDYVTFSFDMSPFRSSLSLCTWIKRIYTSSSYPIIFNYYASSSYTWEMVITPDGLWTQVVGDGGLNSKQSYFNSPTGTWFNLCLTWSLATTTSKLYVNGALIATDRTTSGRSLVTGGVIYFNRLHPSSSTSSNYVFGGQLFEFNMFSKVLSAEEIGNIAAGGLCGGLEEFSDTRVLRWEDIVQRSRRGSVVEIDTGCEQIANLTAKLRATESKLEATESKLDAVTTDLNKTEDALETVTGRLNSTQEELGTVREELRKTKDLLDTEAAERNKTVESLETCTGTLADTRTELGAARRFENITRWDVLYTAPYFNKVFTSELYQQLTSSWEMLQKLVGVNMTDGVVNHFRKYHTDSECGVLDQLSSSWDMLRQFVGVEMTNGLVDHFIDKHDGSDCENNTES